MTTSPAPDEAVSHAARDPRLTGHVTVLDGVRGIAILAVIVFHAVAFDYHNRFELALAMGAAFGWAGVDLFFVLSGFLITGILLKSRSGEGYYRTFYIRRALRIFPLYFALCAVLFGVLPSVYGWSSPTSAMLMKAAPWYFTYTLNIRMALFGGASAVFTTAFLWSLAVEEQFYLIWPAIVKRATLEHLSRLCLAMVVVALCFRIWMVRSGHLFAGYVLLPSRMDGLALGAWLAIQVTKPGMLDRLARIARPVLAVCVVGVLGIVAKTGQAGWEKPLMGTVGLTFTAVASTAFITLLVAGGQKTLLSRAVAVAPLRFFGRYAYGLYVLADAGTRLLNLTGIPKLLPKTMFGSALPWELWYLALVLLFTTLLALLSWNILEQPALALKRFFPYAEQRRVVPAYSVPSPGDIVARAELDEAKSG